MIRPVSIVLSGLFIACAVSPVARASVVVLANQTDQSVTFAEVLPGEKARAYRIAPGDVLPLPARGPITVRFEAGGRVVDRRAVPDSICAFVREGSLDLIQRSFGVDGAVAAPRAEERLDVVGVLPVMILVDEEEPAVRRLWESRLRRRVADASRIFERHCLMRFEVVSVGVWESNDGVTDFSLSLREFEREAPLVPPACLAIGFTSQYRKPDANRVHLGGTRGPLYHHLLVREWSQHISEPERLEVLVHELGHVLGASHSAESASVMRPMVGDRQSRARSFRIGFDPLNTLAMFVFCEQLRLRGARRLADLSPASRAVLSNVYAELQRSLPDDTAASRYLTLLAMSAPRAAAPGPPTLPAATQSVVRAVTRAALADESRPASSDALADYYVRAAAREASRLPKPLAVKAFLSGLVAVLEGRDGARPSVLGKPTIHGREDLLRHFVAAGGLSATVGPAGAASLSSLKETIDGQKAGRFSFSDLAADFAGIEVVTRLAKAELSLDELAGSFEARHFVLPPDRVPEDMTSDAFRKTYGGPNDPRFQQQADVLRRQTLILPGYATKKRP